MDETPLLHLQSEKSIWMDKNGDAGTMSGVTTEETVSFNLPPVYFTYLNYKTGIIRTCLAKGFKSH